MKIKTKILLLIFGILIILLLLSYSIFNEKVSGLVTENKAVANVSDLFRVYNENKLFTEHLASVKQLHIEKQLITAENIELKELKLVVEEYKNYHPIVAAVSYRNFDPSEQQSWYNSLDINKGENQELKVNMPVISSKGLIGLVKEVKDDRAEVQLLSNNNKRSFVPATIAKDQTVFGMIESYDSEQNLLLMNKINTKKEVAIGSVVTTSKESTIFPPGLEIGTVTEVVKDNYGLTNTAMIKPAADFHEINYVIVLNNKE